MDPAHQAYEKLSLEKRTPAPARADRTGRPKRPFGVGLVAVLVFLAGMSGLSSAYATLFETPGQPGMFEILFSFFEVLLSLLYLFLSLGLWKLESWAIGLAKFLFVFRILVGASVVIFLSPDLTPHAAMYKVVSLVELLLYAVMLAYLTSRNVKRLFVG